MSKCKFCHMEVLDNQSEIAGHHKKCTFDYIERNKAGNCTRCNKIANNQPQKDCKECIETNADYMYYEGPVLVQ